MARERNAGARVAVAEDRRVNMPRGPDVPVGDYGGLLALPGVATHVKHLPGAVAAVIVSAVVQALPDDAPMQAVAGVGRPCRRRRQRDAMQTPALGGGGGRPGG